MYIERKLRLNEILEKKSCFLFGPRQTGKSSLIAKSIDQALVFNLLNSDTFRQLSRRPSLLREQVSAHRGPVVIDEIQKLPELLDEVQLLIDETKLHFLLTGSSARKLRRGGINLLGGRARSRRMHPFISEELGDKFDLLKALNWGLLPSIYFSDAPVEDLKSYVGDYLKEEVAEEGLTRNIPAFSRFLEVAALGDGQIVNYTNVASDAEIARSTVQDYFGILRDTLIAEEIEPWAKTKKRKAISKSKFYFFDPGVVNTLQAAGEIKPRSPLFGQAFERFIYHELATYRDYVTQGSLHFWRSTTDDEVDFVLDESIAIEVKGKDLVSQRDLQGLERIGEERLLKHKIVVSLESRPRQVGSIAILPWQLFLKKLWDGEFKE